MMSEARHQASQRVRGSDSMWPPDPLTPLNPEGADS